jgi:hypothetical protein
MGEKSHERFNDRIIVGGVTINVTGVRRNQHALLKATRSKPVWEVMGYVGIQPIYARGSSRVEALTNLKTAMETALGL